MMADERLPWFPCEPAKLLGALAGLKPDQKLVYIIVLLRIYEAWGPCKDSADVLATRCGINRRRIVDALDALYKLDKLYNEDGGMMNPVARQVMVDSEAKHKRRVSAGQGGGLASAKKHKGNQRGEPSKATATLKQLHLQEQDSLFPRGNRPNAGLESSERQLAPDAELYRRGREVLGSNVGGLITQLLNCKGGNIALARAALEQASTKDKPREFIGGVLRGRVASPSSKNGIADLILESMEERRDDYDDDSNNERTVPSGADGRVVEVYARGRNR